MRTGTFHECLQDYLRAIDTPQRRRLAELIGCDDQAISRWVKQTNLPVGNSSLRLFHVMEAVGFTITGWKSTNTDVLTVARCVTFHVLTSEQVAAKLASPNTDTNGAVQMMVGNRHIKPDNLQVFAALAAEFGPLLGAAKVRWQDILILDEKSRAINELANRLKEMLPLAESVASDHYTGQERLDLRKRSGEATIFNLYNILGALCGERAREHVIHSAGMLLRKD